MPSPKEDEESSETVIYTLSEDETHYDITPNVDKVDDLTTLTVPATYEGLPVAIPNTAFRNCKKLTTLEIDGVKSIGKDVFSNCVKLETVTLTNVTAIPSGCFRSCRTLETVNVDSSLVSVGDNAFQSCIRLANIIINENITTIGKYAYAGCSAIISLQIPDYVTEIKDYAFSSCENLQSVTMGEGVTSIGIEAFADCGKLASLTLNENLTSIGNYAFKNTVSLQSVKFPTKNALTIGSYAFSYAGLTEIKIPANVKLGDYAFDHVNWDGESGVSKCVAIYFYSTSPTASHLGINSVGYTWDRNDGDVEGLAKFTVYVPNGCLQAYKNVCQEIYAKDDAWVRCVTSVNKMAEFDVTAYPYD